MERKVNLSWLPIRLGLFLLLISVPQLLAAQEDNTGVSGDSTLVNPESVMQQPSLPGFSLEKTAESSLYPSGQSGQPIRFLPKEKLYIPYQTDPSPLFRGDYQTNGIVKGFRHGALYGSGGQTSLPGIGRFNDASLGYQHAFNQKLAFQLQANAMKINMPHITGQAFSTSGALLYRPTDRVAFKLFGSYDIGNSYGMSTHRYGATMSVDMSDRFGMEMGVQRYYDPMRGRWETAPIMIPYYRFEKFTLGLDVGGLVYEILREVVFDKQRRGGPTIAPPRFQIPIR